MKEKGMKIFFQKSKQRNGKEKDDLLNGTYRRFTKKKRKKEKKGKGTCDKITTIPLYLKLCFLSSSLCKIFVNFIVID